MNHNEMRKLASERCPACGQSKLACKGTRNCWRVVSAEKKKVQGLLVPGGQEGVLLYNVAEQIANQYGRGSTISADIVVEFMMKEEVGNSTDHWEIEQAIELIDSLEGNIRDVLKDEYGITMSGTYSV